MSDVFQGIWVDRLVFMNGELLNRPGEGFLWGDCLDTNRSCGGTLRLAYAILLQYAENRQEALSMAMEFADTYLKRLPHDDFHARIPVRAWIARTQLRRAQIRRSMVNGRYINVA
jgi:predicted transcriptional regulator of viral defense system